MSHTKGKLAVNADRIESEKDHGWANDGWIVAKCEGPDAFNNARRLVACWNACEGISTEGIERIVSLLDNGQIPSVSLARQNDELLAENERLREAAEKVVASIRNEVDNATFANAIENLRAALEGK